MGIEDWPAGLVRSVAVPLITTPDSAINPTKAAIRNVTLDFDELTSLVVEFMQSGQVDPAVQVSFREFLSEKATT
ncbi:hypothetical protein QBZ16_002098 [Prototheca wickerhamii]|uniref:Uncharacterized protein n=1 Tax=Prototheca wickerhamii TaxID=3111 RepID=A0AAD9IJZ1_PROWI|nr:hypothetical protein QBZ16_002098 [Prototheca wickerhamii]